ncbi:MAG: uroporphyrinogen-III synthase [Gemmataceae bacterium]
MTRPLEGRRVALAEGRQLEDLARMLEAEGAVPVRCPMLSILDAPDAGPVRAWLDDLPSFDLVILMTGEAVRRLAGLAERDGRRERFVADLGRVPTLTRGPKPGQALRELGLSASRVAAAPTTDGVIASLGADALDGKRVGYTLYASDNPTLDGFLRGRGASPEAVLSYVYAPSADEGRVAALIEDMAAGAVDGLVITSTPQTERLFEVARKLGLEGRLLEGLKRVQVSAVGPVAAAGLLAHGVRVDVCPEQGFVMKNLVKQMGRL